MISVRRRSPSLFASTRATSSSACARSREIETRPPIVSRLSRESVTPWMLTRPRGRTPTFNWMRASACRDRSSPGMVRASCRRCGISNPEVESSPCWNNRSPSSRYSATEFARVTRAMSIGRELTRFATLSNWRSSRPSWNESSTSSCRAFASSASSRARWDSRLPMTAVARNASRATQFCVSLIVKKPIGGRKK